MEILFLLLELAAKLATIDDMTQLGKQTFSS